MTRHTLLALFLSASPLFVLGTAQAAPPAENQASKAWGKASDAERSLRAQRGVLSTKIAQLRERQATLSALTGRAGYVVERIDFLQHYMATNARTPMLARNRDYLTKADWNARIVNTRAELASLQEELPNLRTKAHGAWNELSTLDPELSAAERSAGPLDTAIFEHSLARAPADLVERWKDVALHHMVVSNRSRGARQELDRHLDANNNANHDLYGTTTRLRRQAESASAVTSRASEDKAAVADLIRLGSSLTE